MRRLLVFVVTLLGVYSTTVFVTPSAAADHCSDVTYALGHKLLANSSPTSGPHPVAVPAGDYRLVMTSSDPTHADSPPVQNSESWFFTTDSGFTSPTTPDLPDTDVFATFDLGVFALPATTTITFHHGSAEPGTQSVAPTVTFVCASPEPTTTLPPTTNPSTTAPPTTAPPTTGAPTTTPGSVAPTTVPPTGVPPTTVPATTAPATTAPATTLPAETSPPTTVSVTSTPGSVLPAPSLVQTTTTLKGEVLPITITPGPGGDDLARTGGDLSILWLATILLGAGLGLVGWSRRLQHRA